jgi:hypothetical protein
MLFSATQTNNVKELAALSMRQERPVYVGVDDDKTIATVEGLEQGYVICPSETRFLLLFTFLKKNRKKKVIVFMSSCSAVKFFAELLNYIDIPVMELHVCVEDSFRCSEYECSITNWQSATVSVSVVLSCYRAVKSKTSEPIRSSNFVTPLVVS